MRRSRFTEEQIIGVLREQEADGKTAGLCRKHGISPATFYQWKAKFGSLDVSEARWLRTLEAENARLKKLLADAPLGDSVLKDVAAKKMVTRVAHRRAVSAAREAHGISERPACAILGAEPSLIRCRSTRPDDASMRVRLRDLAAERRRFGYRRLGLLLAREGVRLNNKKLRRLHREEGLAVRRHGGRKRALGTRATGTEKRRSTEPKNTATMRLTATTGSVSDRREKGGQVTSRKRRRIR